MEKVLQSSHQQIEADRVLNRISTLTDRRFFDYLFYRVLNTGGSKLADGKSAYFPLADCQVQHVSGDRSTGVTFKIANGVGFRKNAAAPTADEPAFEPIYVDDEPTFVTANSDPTDPRMDRVWMKPAQVDTNSQSVNIIDPNPPNNITAEARDLNRKYTYAYAYAAGTPDPGAAGGTGAPAPPVGFTADDLIAEILIDPGSGAFDPGDLDDKRDLLEVDQNLQASITTFPADQVTLDPTVQGQSDAQAALESLESDLANAVPAGLIQGKLQYVNTGSVRIAPVFGLVRIEIDDVVLAQSAALVWDLSTDFEASRSEAASQMLYLYVADSAGSMLPKVSDIAPELNIASKVGYHPTNTGWRCVGACVNDSSSNIVPFTQDGRWQSFLESDPSVLVHALGTTVPTAWTVQALNIPLGSDAVRLLLVNYPDDVSTVIGRRSAATALPGTAPGGNFHTYAASGMESVLMRAGSQISGGPSNIATAEDEIPIDDPTTPGIAWGNIIEGGTPSLNGESPSLRVTGFSFAFAGGF